MLLGVGYAVPFSFLGIVLSFVVFSVVFLIAMSIKQILESQNFIW